MLYLFLNSVKLLNIFFHNCWWQDMKFLDLTKSLMRDQHCSSTTMVPCLLICTIWWLMSFYINDVAYVLLVTDSCSSFQVFCLHYWWWLHFACVAFYINCHFSVVLYKILLLLDSSKIIQLIFCFLLFLLYQNTFQVNLSCQNVKLHKGNRLRTTSPVSCCLPVQLSHRFSAAAEVVAVPAGEAQHHIQDRGGDPQGADNIHATIPPWHASHRDAGQADVLRWRSSALCVVSTEFARRVFSSWTNCLQIAACWHSDFRSALKTHLFAAQRDN